MTPRVERALKVIQFHKTMARMGCIVMIIAFLILSWYYLASTYDTYDKYHLLRLGLMMLGIVIFEIFRRSLRHYRRSVRTEGKIIDRMQNNLW